MPRKGTDPNVVGIALGNDSRHMLDRLKLALRTVVDPTLEPSRSWLIAQCIAFTYAHSPAFVAGYLPGEINDEGQSHVHPAVPADGSLPPQAPAPGPPDTGGGGTDPVCGVSGDTRTGDGPPVPDRPKRARPRIRAALPGRDSQSQ